MDSLFDNLGLTTNEGYFIIKATIVTCAVGFFAGFLSKKVVRNQESEESKRDNNKEEIKESNNEQ